MSTVRVVFVVDCNGCEHLGIMYMSSMLKNRGYSVEIVEARFDAVRNRLSDTVKTILAYNVPTRLAMYYGDLNRRIKHFHNVLSIFGGPHPTAVPEIIEEEGIDAVCMGEGEFALLELVEKMSNNEDITNIQNLWVKNNGNITKNPLRPIIHCLDSLPFADRNLFSRYPSFDNTKMHVITQRGCSFHCSFCFNNYYQKLYGAQSTVCRRHSVKYVIEDIVRHTKNSYVRFVMFEDDVFTNSLEWLREFAIEYERCVAIPFSCKSRVDLIDETTVRCLKKAGCHSISIGVEVADDFLRNSLLKKNISKQQIINAVQMFKQQRIKVRISSLIGFPFWPIEKDLETLQFIIQLGADYNAGTRLMFFPKTELRKTVDDNDLDSRFRQRAKDSSPYYRGDNLMYLFPITTEFPIIFHCIRFLIRLPFRRVYHILYYIWEGYCVSRKIYPSQSKTGIKRYWNFMEYALKDRS